MRYKKPELIKQLERALLEQKRLKYPNIPDECLAPITHTDKTANGLTKAIIAFIKLRGGQAERITSSGRVIQHRGRATYIPGTSTNGTADISATIKGRSVKIEVKIGADRQSPAQIAYQKAIEKAGGLYVIAKDFTTFCGWYRKMFN